MQNNVDDYMTQAEKKSKMDSIIGIKNETVENNFLFLANSLLTLCQNLREEKKVGYNREKTYEMTSINTEINLGLEPQIMLVGGAAYQLLDSYFRRYFRITPMRNVASRTNDFDIMICVKSLKKEIKVLLLSIVTKFINSLELPASLTRYLNKFDDNSSIDNPVEVVHDYLNNRYFQITSINKKRYFNVRVNLQYNNIVSHLFEVVLWKNSDKSECNITGVRIRTDSKINNNFVMIPNITDLLENTTRVILRRGSFNIPKCRQDYQRAMWLYNTLKYLYQSKIVNKNLSLFGDKKTGIRIEKQINLIKKISSHCDTDNNHILDLESQNKYKNLIDDENIKIQINSYFKDLLKPFDEDNIYDYDTSKQK